MAGLVNYSAVLQDAGGSNLRFVASEHKFQTWGAGQSGTSGLSGILASSNQTTVMTIRGSNVGIGVTAPVAKLQVAGGVGIGTAYAAIAPPADGCIVAGNVGIGTASPVATLQVAGSVGIGAAYAAFVPPADGCIVAGNVGIGTTNPLAKLHVNGTIQTSDGIAMAMNSTATSGGHSSFIHPLACESYTGSAAGVSSGIQVKGLEAFCYYFASQNLYNFWRIYINLIQGTYRFDLSHGPGVNRGIMTLNINNINVGTIDAYASAGAYNIISTINNIIISSTGIYKIELQMNSKNANSSSYYLTWANAAFVRIS